MDEPFGALDPITKARLQQELLRLQAAVEKTVIFVTHDVDEAMTMGDRIAILRDGGALAQYDAPDVILARPADDFVARFVGDDRALRRLALLRTGELELESAADADSLPVASAQMNVRSALALMLESRSDAVRIVDEQDVTRGVLTLSSVQELL
jgi:osmoprotectant transport system ATP-binding protein